MILLLVELEEQTRIERAFALESSGQQFAMDVNNWVVIKREKTGERQADF